MVVDRGGSTRYHLLETIRQYARDRLVAADETTELRNRHLAFYLRLALDAEHIVFIDCVGLGLSQAG